MFALTAAAQSLFFTFGAWLEDEFGFGAVALTAVTFGIGGLELAASTTSAARVDRWGKERSVVFGAGLMVPMGLALAAFGTSFVPGVLALGVFIALFEFSIVSSISIGSELVPGAPARGLSAVIAAATMGRAAAATPATWLYEQHGIWVAGPHRRSVRVADGAVHHPRGGVAVASVGRCNAAPAGRPQRVAVGDLEIRLEVSLVDVDGEMTLEDGRRAGSLVGQGATSPDPTFPSGAAPWRSGSCTSSHRRRSRASARRPSIIVASSTSGSTVRVAVPLTRNCSPTPGHHEPERDGWLFEQVAARVETVVAREIRPCEAVVVEHGHESWRPAAWRGVGTPRTGGAHHEQW
ncbi:MAG: hypothetical protein WKF58_06975 [Ilumatobacteraceae bacterium]